MKPLLRNIIFLILWFGTLYLIFSNLRGCENTKLKTIYKSDTIIEHKTDTVWAKDTTYVLRFFPKQIDSLYVHDTINSECDYVRFYRDSINDTNLTINIDYIVKGKLIGSGATYKLKIPLVIYDTTLIKITDKIDDKYRIYGGLEVAFKSFSPYIDVEFRKFQVGASYDIYNKTPKVRIGYKLYSK